MSHELTTLARSERQAFRARFYKQPGEFVMSRATLDALAAEFGFDGGLPAATAILWDMPVLLDEGCDLGQITVRLRDPIDRAYHAHE